jgi:hypothetical protein
MKTYMSVCAYLSLFVEEKNVSNECCRGTSNYTFSPIHFLRQTYGFRDSSTNGYYEYIFQLFNN